MEMEHLDTTFSPSSQEHQKSPVSGGETPSPPAEEKETAQNGGKKALCSLYITFWARCRSRGLVASGMQAGRLVSSMGSTSRSHVPGLGEGYGRGGTW